MIINLIVFLLRSKDARKTLSVESPTIEDIESGIGQSLPSSPTSELSSTRDSAGYELKHWVKYNCVFFLFFSSSNVYKLNQTLPWPNQKPQYISSLVKSTNCKWYVTVKIIIFLIYRSETYSDLAMSLCGDLKSGKVSLGELIVILLFSSFLFFSLPFPSVPFHSCADLFSESFMSNKVTFEDLSSNPSLLNDPKLVIRINDRYVYNSRLLSEFWLKMGCMLVHSDFHRYTSFYLFFFKFDCVSREYRCLFI